MALVCFIQQTGEKWLHLSCQATAFEIIRPSQLLEPNVLSTVEAFYPVRTRHYFTSLTAKKVLFLGQHPNLKKGTNDKLRRPTNLKSIPQQDEEDTYNSQATVRHLSDMLEASRSADALVSSHDNAVQGHGLNSESKVDLREAAELMERLEDSVRDIGNEPPTQPLSKDEEELDRLLTNAIKADGEGGPHLYTVRTRQLNWPSKVSFEFFWETAKGPIVVRT